MMKLPRYRIIDDLEHGTDSAIHTARQKDKDNKNDKPYRAWLYDDGAHYIPGMGHTHPDPRQRCPQLSATSSESLVQSKG